MKERIAWIDYVKGVAIVCVVLGHVVSSYHNSNLYLNNYLFNFTHQFVYSFHMALFLIVSGYLVSRGKKVSSKRKQAIQTIINYGIPYIVFSALWCFLKMVMPGHRNTPLTLNDLMLIPVYPISFMWFIYTLLLMHLIHIYVASNCWKIKIFHLAFAGGVYFLQPCLVRQFDWIRFSDCIISDFFNNYIFFLIGAYLAEHIAAWGPRFIKVITIISGMVLIWGNVICFNFNLPISRIVSFILAVVGSLFIITLCMQLEHNKLIEYLGRRSLPIYVLHALAISATRLLLTKFNLNICYGILSLVICTFVGCVFPIVAYQISTKIWKLDGCFYPGKYLKA